MTDRARGSRYCHKMHVTRQKLLIGRSKIDFLGIKGGQNLHTTVSVHHYCFTMIDKRQLIDEKFRRFASKIGAFMSSAMFRGGRSQVSQGADSKYQC